MEFLSLIFQVSITKLINGTFIHSIVKAFHLDAFSCQKDDISEISKPTNEFFPLFSKCPSLNLSNGTFIHSIVKAFHLDAFSCQKDDISEISKPTNGVLSLNLQVAIIEHI